MYIHERAVSGIDAITAKHTHLLSHSHSCVHMPPAMHAHIQMYPDVHTVYTYVYTDSTRVGISASRSVTRSGTAIYPFCAFWECGSSYRSPESGKSNDQDITRNRDDEYVGVRPTYAYTGNVYLP